jgi:hypothetical protein
VTALDDLIRAVEAAHGGYDPILDRAVRRMFDPQMGLHSSQFSISIDAVVALIRREMPGARFKVYSDVAGLIACRYDDPDTGAYGTASKRTEPLARILAFLRAVKAKQQDDAT